jgi:catalase
MHMNVCRQERFINRWIDALSDPRLTHEIKAIWLSYWAQVIHQAF